MGERPGPAWVGLMSGTSLDGISAVVVRFGSRGAGFSTELAAFEVTEYDSDQRERLRVALHGGSARDYCRLAFDLGSWLADAAVRVIAESGIPRDEIRAIGTHGQTIWHEPPHSTWQLGETAVIAERTGLPVIGDFRVADVAAGGEGAPLVPIADALLFSHETEWRALQNIGGIGNVTIVAPGGGIDGRGRITGMRAFDTGPGVAVIDAVVRALYQGARYDEDGRWAAAGTVNDEVVSELLAHPYFASEPPKSTGRELFDDRYVASFIESCRARGAGKNEDIVATATALTAASIADAFRRFVAEPVTELLVSGGGAKNETLVAMIRRKLPDVAVRDFAELYFDGEAKEAVAFALLARLHVDGRPGNVPGATGARGGRVLGKVTPAPVGSARES